jgi:hypothetical protein
MPGGILDQGSNIVRVGSFECNKDDVVLIVLLGSICGWGGGRDIIILINFCLSNEEAKSGDVDVEPRFWLPLMPITILVQEDADGTFFSIRTLLRKAWETFSRATCTSPSHNQKQAKQ